MSPEFEQWIQHTANSILIGAGIGVVIAAVISAVVFVVLIRKIRKDDKKYEEWKKKHNLDF